MLLHPPLSPSVIVLACSVPLSCLPGLLPPGVFCLLLMVLPGTRTQWGAVYLTAAWGTTCGLWLCLGDLVASPLLGEAPNAPFQRPVAQRRLSVLGAGGPSCSGSLSPIPLVLCLEKVPSPPGLLGGVREREGRTSCLWVGKGVPGHRPAPTPAVHQPLLLSEPLPALAFLNIWRLCPEHFCGSVGDPAHIWQLRPPQTRSHACPPRSAPSARHLSCSHGHYQSVLSP